ncbi:prolyl oligopeptidase family serine peptidase [Pricia sp. S334]|uniref:Prolyl oligopeptidase family serine peptidase n=1 Tax=Pricia mediterranea TaxID=3076079 RepID=A0ABU3L6Q9_9FLAO|nr:prolyl oligopeptidase family serine peptidase [Pricia sp. S334]MDT7829372.1 prolyl oligopeptidase family serine peptidase [Pricia sp. S334]
MRTKKLLSTVLLLSYGCVALAQEHSLYKKEHFIDGKDTLLYRILYPKNFSEDDSYPLILFLHGGGERGNDNEKQLTHGSRLFANPSHRKEFPAIVIFPQCPADNYWSNVAVDRSSYPIGLDFQYAKGPTEPLSLVMELLDEFRSKDYVDRNQMYVMGLSMGGMGTYELLSRKPDVFAAAISICGAGEPESVTNYATKVPLWAFHGARDNVVDPQHSLTMVSALLKEGGHPKFTLYDDANHNSWDNAFGEPGLLPWLFSHSR